MRSSGQWRLPATVAVAGMLGVSATLLWISGASTAADASTTSSGNLLTGDQSTFDTSTGGWSGVGATLGDVASPVQAGAGALSVTAEPANGVGGGGSMSVAESPRIAAVAGDRYAATAYAQGSTIGRPVGGVLVFYDSTGKQLTAVWGQAVSDGPGAWTSLPPVVGLAPAGTASVVLAVSVYGALQGEVHYVDTASMTATAVSVPAVAGPLTTVGNQIFDAANVPVVLRGINRTGTQSDRFPTDAEIGQMQGWGADIVRVPLNESLWLNTCSDTSPSNLAGYPSSVDAEVDAITSRGMVALLDLHWNVIQPCGTPAQYNMADALYAPTFWSQLASRYRGNLLVAFDLYNEPHNIPDAVWLNGGKTTDYYSGVTYTAAGMQQLYDTVRGTGATNLVFATGQTWGSRPSRLPLVGVNIVNAVHDYTCPNNPPPNCSTANPYDPSPILDNWLVTARAAPVMVTEGGWPAANDGTYNTNLVADTESHGWGWILFAWTGTSTTGFSLVGSYGATYEPNPSGMPVLQGLERNG